MQTSARKQGLSGPVQEAFAKLEEERRQKALQDPRTVEEVWEARRKKILGRTAARKQR